MTLTELPVRTTADRGGHFPSGRWAPTRAGILNVWRYYDEIFEFHNGRLLLRGPNGTGKSKALELLLPFLFDANLRASRLSTFGTGERTMHWNLMGDGATGTTRVGYVWMEFSLHRPGDGTRSWFCCGARLQASAHTTSVHADYFTTSQRIGVAGGLRLVNDSGQPLTRAGLSDTLGEYGELHGSAAEYRTAIRSTLFGGMSEQRYDALITALLQLRTPKLSERLDPALLSHLLSRALPPLGHAEITELAEGFERLDRQREQLDKLDEEVAAARTLAARQRSYAQRVLRASAAALISATSELTVLTRTARLSDEEYEETVAENAETEQRRAALEAAMEELQGKIDGLTAGDEYQKGRELDELRQRVTKRQRAAGDLRRDADAKARTAKDDADQAAAAQQTVAQMSAAADAAEQDANRAAHRAGIPGAHTEIAALLHSENQQPARTMLSAAVRNRQEQIADVRRALDRYDATVQKRGYTEQELEQARAELSRATAFRSETLRAFEVVLGALREQLRHWATSCTELVFDDLDALTDRADSEAAVVELVESVSSQVLQAVVAEETRVAAQRETASLERRRISQEIAGLRDMVDLPPDASIARTADRSTMAGAPLWRLVTYAEGVSPPIQAAVEAALQASGLLDAWVSLDGGVEVAGHDTFVVADLLGEVADRSLIEVLRPEPDSSVPAGHVRRLLSQIAYGEALPDGHGAAIGADGRWRLGNATGSWAKPEAEHIGATARERSRQRRIAELTAQVDTLEATIAGNDAGLAALADRRGQIDRERDSRPRHTQVDAARTKADRAESAVGASDGAVRRWVSRLSACEEAVREALKGLTATASERGLPTARDRLDALDRAAAAFRDVADNWLDTHTAVVAAGKQATALTERAERSQDIAAERAGEADLAEAELRQLAGRLEGLERSVGADYRQVIAEIDQLRRSIAHSKEQAADAERTLRDLAGRIGALQERRSTDAIRRDVALSSRDSAAARFKALAVGSLPDDAGIRLGLSVSDAVRPTLEAARHVAATWPSVPYSPKNISDAFGRLAEAVHTCRETLSADLELEPDEDIHIFAAAVDGVRVGANGLLTMLQTEAERSRDDITAAERDLFDKTLTGDTRRHLAARIRQASGLVDAMNERLERVRTASNVAVQLVWQVGADLPPGTKAARDLLLKDPVRLTAVDRESLHRFFRDRIERAKANNTASSWEEQLAEVFDYTSWHQFVVRLDRADGSGWQRLTKKLHGALSGGEKAIALHLPLFAAVAAHHQSVEQAPRLILLDEVFVGVDSTNRGQVFDLLSSLDLDLMLTSDHEWCTYRELDGIAIHQLITGGDGDDAVTTARFVWTGHDLVGDQAEQ